MTKRKKKEEEKSYIFTYIWCCVFCVFVDTRAAFCFVFFFELKKKKLKYYVSLCKEFATVSGRVGARATPRRAKGL